LVGFFVDVGDVVAGAFEGFDEFVEFEIDGFVVVALGALEEKDGEDGDECHRGVQVAFPTLGEFEIEAGEEDSRQQDEQRPYGTDKIGYAVGEAAVGFFDHKRICPRITRIERE
jgi:hypothetical protein